MPSHYLLWRSRPTAQAGTSFVTIITHNRRRLFQVTAAPNCSSKPSSTIAAKAIILHAFVVMPDHLHLLLIPQAITLERAVVLIKGGFSRRLASSFPVWQRSFTDHRIRDAQD